MSRSSRWTMPGRSASPTAGDLGVAGHQAVHQRAGDVAGAGVHHQAGGLVDDEHVVVLVHDGERRPTGRPRPPAPGSGPASTSTSSPSATLTLPGGDRPRRRRAPRPPPPSAAASARLRPVMIDTSRSRRSPASAAGIGLLDHGLRKLRMARRPAPDADGDVGHVEDGPPLHVDEVDHGAAEQARAARRRGRAGCPARRRPPARPRPAACPASAGRRRAAPAPTTRPIRLISPPRPSPNEKAVPELNAEVELERADDARWARRRGHRAPTPW